MIEKITRMNDLYDLYEPLLTTKQKDYFELYYQDDLSLSEIAEQYQISRTAVFDNIKRTEKALEHYEEKLAVFKKRSQRLELIEQLEVLSELPQIQALKALDELE